VPPEDIADANCIHHQVEEFKKFTITLTGKSSPQPSLPPSLLRTMDKDITCIDCSRAFPSLQVPLFSVEQTYVLKTHSEFE
jgi:hypothetical protein